MYKKITLTTKTQNDYKEMQNDSEGMQNKCKAIYKRLRLEEKLK